MPASSGPVLSFSRLASASCLFAVVLLLLAPVSRAQIDTPDCTDTDDWSWVSKPITLP